MAVPSASRPVAIHQANPPPGAPLTAAQYQAARAQAAQFQQQQQQAQGAPRGMMPRPAASPFGPTGDELRPGQRNRLFLALRSGVDDEVDWALPRLVLGSYDRDMQLEQYLDSDTILCEWPAVWVDELEREAAYRTALRNPDQHREALGAVPDFTRHPVTEARATYSLQVLRNLSLVQGNNARHLSRGRFLDVLLRIFSLPMDFLLEVAQRTPEPILHLLVVLQRSFEFLHPSPEALHVLNEVLPTLTMHSRDIAILSSVLPILVKVYSNAYFNPPPDGFIQHMLYLLTLTGSTELLELVLDLLAAMVPMPQHSRAILSEPSFPAHLRTLVGLLEYGSTAQKINFQPPPALRGRDVINPACDIQLARQACLLRRAEREADESRMEMFGGPGVFREVGDEAPQLAPSITNELYHMTETKRSVAW